MAGDNRAGAESATRLLQDAAAAEALARERTASAAVDLSLPARSRLNDYQRSTVDRLLETLLAEVEGELRAGLAPGLRQAASPELAAALEAVRAPIARRILARAGALADSELIAALILRADEHRAASVLRRETHPSDGGVSPLDGWVRDENSEVRAAASALLVAESRRVGPAREPLLPRAELAAEQQHRLVWRVAAALRHYLVAEQQLPAADADRLIAMAAPAALARFDEGEAVSARAYHLVRLLGSRLDDAALQALVESGELALAAASLAARARIGCGAAMEMLLDAGGARAALLLAAAGVAREPGSAVLVRLALALGAGEQQAIERAEGFAGLDGAAAREAVRPFGLDPDYRAAIELIAGGLDRDRWAR